METRIIDGKAIAQQIREEIREQVAILKEKGTEITLAVVLVGEDPASKVYVRNKKNACEFAGIISKEILLPADITQEALLDTVRQLNEDPAVNGILVQLPLPKGLDADAVIRAIAPEKDVDGFHPQSVGALSIGLPGFVSCTPAGIIELLRRSDIDCEGKECVIVGRSNIVGKPMGMLMLRENATVTIAHSRTKNLREVTSRADILITAVGKAKLFHADDIKEGAVVIDCGMNRDEEGRLCGDVDTADCMGKASFITPVPGGVGPMTVTMLLKNCLDSVSLHSEETV
ncbi:MAG: bifunctional methylenetetrahydrofolate dehydrogenase/methenyltetrahydrofolate cyclohydrolase FolD [Lachnospiraceae bacterium]|nr:bifunctional methylenetetrahydrofolate dehydrogenase/methenyltetrahydrofolate cyclohydrolase FolD [Lachnospiraceae bacterium]